MGRLLIELKTGKRLQLAIWVVIVVAAVLRRYIEVQRAIVEIFIVLFGLIEKLVFHPIKQCMMLESPRDLTRDLTVKACRAPNAPTDIRRQPILTILHVLLDLSTPWQAHLETSMDHGPWTICTHTFRFPYLTVCRSQGS